MTRQLASDTADIKQYTVYFTGTVLYIPSYQDEDIYVAPGNREYHKNYLEEHASKTTLMLWNRTKAK